MSDLARKANQSRRRGARHLRAAAMIPPVCAAALIASCAAVPKLGPAAVARTPVSLASARSFAAPDAPWPTTDWWAALGDPQLDAVIAHALAGAPDIAAAQARVARAAAAEGDARADLLPMLEGNGSAVLRRQSEEIGLPTPRGWKGFGELSLDFSYELDFWGKNRKALRAAVSDTRAAEADAHAARLMLSTAIGVAYVELYGDLVGRDVAERALRIRRDTRALIERRRARGLAAWPELRQAQAGESAAVAQLAAADEAIALVRNRIAALAGEGPDYGLRLVRPRLAGATPLGLPASLSADLLGRKPEVVAARWRAEAAAQRVGVARTRFYPNVNLLGLIGLQSLGFGDLFKTSATYGSVGPAITLPIFEGGRLRAEYRGARADYDLAVAQYDDALVQAFREVADAAASLRALDARRVATARALAEREDAYRLARQSYEAGVTDFQSVLNPEDALLSAQAADTDLLVRGLALRVALIRALGGGFQSNPLPDPKVP